MLTKKIKSALVSVYYKDGLDEIVRLLNELGVTIYSTGGTQTFIESFGIPVIRVEDLTGYPSILDGRVKTLHPKIFGGILAKREDGHLIQLNQYDIPTIDLVIVDLYPFEETVISTKDESAIIEKIDIGGISLIRAAAKNYHDVVIIPSQEQYRKLADILKNNGGVTSLEERRDLAHNAFGVSSHYDSAIFQYFGLSGSANGIRISINNAMTLRYGENPHQNASFYGNLNEIFDILCGKELSYNNLVDVDAAVQLMSEFKNELPCFAILKHTNACGVAIRDTPIEAWKAALAGDPVSAFGGILICNSEVDIATAIEINEIFYEVLIAPSFTEEAFNLLKSKPKRILLKLKKYPDNVKGIKNLLNGIIVQDTDTFTESVNNLLVKTKLSPDKNEMEDLVFAAICAKHLKSNTIVLAKNRQLLGMGCGQTSRVDACEQAIHKAKQFGFDLNGAVMASDAFFPFPDCVELAFKAGVKAVIQPGGSVKDQLSIDYCDTNNMAMVFTGFRHFKH
ncbi:MAG: bifunctional phosphoribosylaminoimidazolecarboxamide formyltransferase/IMP cyclohydrolase [Saprospiraceae bacterium]|nr:bifunctional phosphoribosylaminoimidazolecarboxamide formyltransferase/IMP cyclohydrolase [Saprospiraceae bacterium]